MAFTKSLSPIITAGTSNGAGATTTGTAVDLTTKGGATISIKLTNGATGPTVAPAAYVYTSGDNTNWKLREKVFGDSIASSVTEAQVDLPASVMYARVDVKDNTGQAVTCEALAQILATI